MGRGHVWPIPIHAVANWTKPGAVTMGQTTDDDGSEPLFTRIGAMLIRHALDPTPAHYNLCHGYLSGGESVYGVAIDRLITRFGGLTPQAISELGDPAAPAITADTLRKLADDAALYLERVTGLIDDNGREIAAYGDALADKAALLVDTAEGTAAMDGLVALTRRMIDRSRDASDHLRRTGAEIDTLRSKLVEARQVAESDALTGLPNRRALDLRMADACVTAAETGRPLSVAICDIDRFKLVNDAHGHLVGDEVIRLVGAALADVGDAFVSRYGGEEFVVLFEDRTPQDAAARIDTIRRALSERDIKITSTGRRLGRITFSAGVAALGPCGLPAAMLRRADRALYRAKDAGRNTVLLDLGQDDAGGAAPSA